MSDVNQIADIQISVSNPRITRAGFGTGLFLGMTSAFPERARTYFSKESVGEDHEADSEEYLFASMYFGQELSPSKLVIGRRLGAVEQANEVTIAGTILEDETFTAEVGRTEFEYIAGATPTPTSVATGLAALIDADAKYVAVAVAGVITVSAVDKDVSFLLKVSTDSVDGTIASAGDDVTNAETIKDALDAINLVTRDYYGVTHTKRGTIEDQISDIEDLATETKTRAKLHGWSTNEAESKAGTAGNVFETLRLQTNNLTIGIWSANHDLYPEAGWFGGQFPKPAGSTNWKFKPIVGALPDTFSDTEYTNLKANNANFLEEINGRVFVSSEAQTCGGEYVDIIRGIHATEAKMSEDCLIHFLSTEVIRFTQPGMQSLGNDIQGVLYEKAANPINLYVESSIKVDVGKVEDVDISEKANRKFLGTTFEAQLQGAINFIGIRGKVYS